MSFTLLRNALLVAIIALILVVALSGCRAARYGWQASADPPPASGIDTSLTIDDITPSPTPPPPGSDGHEPSSNGDGEPDLAAIGEAVVQANGCIACHSLDGSSGIGPTWLGVFGSTETLSDGSTVLVDETYLEESIMDPGAKLVDGFQPNMMPAAYAGIMSQDEVRALIAYIKTIQ